MLQAENCMYGHYFNNNQDYDYTHAALCLKHLDHMSWKEFKDL